MLGIPLFKLLWENIINKPTEFTPTAHNHVLEDLTDATNLKAIDSLTTTGFLINTGSNTYVQRALLVADIPSLPYDLAGTAQTLIDNLPSGSNFDGQYSSLSGIPSSFIPSTHDQDWGTIQNTPTTIGGYGITDAFDGDYTSLANVPSTFSPSAHTHTIANVIGLQTALDGKASTSSLFSGNYTDLSNIPSTFTPSAHNQNWSTITNTPTTLSGYGITDAFDGNYDNLTNKPDLSALFSGDYADLDNIPTTFIPATHTQDWSTVTSTPTTLAGYGITDAFDGAYGDLSGIPTTFTPAAHNQAISTITGLQTILDNKANTSQLFSGAYGDLSGLPTLFDGQYSSLGGIPSTFTPAAHSQSISTITGLQTALDVKAPLNAPDFTNPTANTPTSSDSSTKLATTAMVQAIKTEILNDLRIKVDDLYFSTNATNPATRLGYGTWEVYAAGRVLVGVDLSDTDFDASGKTAGEKEHSLTITEMPEHGHQQAILASLAGGTQIAADVGQQVDAIYNQTDYSNTGRTSLTGGGQPHNNLQPSIAVHIWRRTA